MSIEPTKSAVEKFAADTAEFLRSTYDYEQLIRYTVQLSIDYAFATEKRKKQIMEDYGSKSEQMTLFNYDKIPDCVIDPTEILELEKESYERQLEVVQNKIDKVVAELRKEESVQSKSNKNKTKKNGKKKKSTKLKVAKTVDIYHDDEFKPGNCPECGDEMVKAGYQTRTKYVHVPGHFVEEKHHYPTYVCPNKCSDEDGTAIIESTLPKDDSLVPGSPVTPSAIAGIAFEKFINCTPLYRLAASFSYGGTTISRQTMSNWMMKGSELYLAAVADKMIQDFRSLDVVHVDETPLICLELKDERKTSYMIAGRSGPWEEKQMIVYMFSEGRAQSFVPALLGDSFHGALMTDGLQAYANYHPALNLNCHAHTRREFIKAMKLRDDYKIYNKLPQGEKEAYLKTHPNLKMLTDVIRNYWYLYSFEESAKKQGLNPDEVYAVRQKLSRPMMKNLVASVEAVEREFYEGSSAYKAARYFLNRQEKLEAYLDDGRYPIDNNRAEGEAIKPLVMSRKNFLFSNTIRGAEATAVYMTLLISAIENNLNPIKYLEHVLTRLQKEGIRDEVLEEVVPYSEKLPKDLYLPADEEEEIEQDLEDQDQTEPDIESILKEIEENGE